MDFCKALSAAIFENVTDTVVYTDLPASARFQALQDGDVDVLSRLTTVTLSRDALEPNTGVGFAFSQPNFYDGLTFGGIPPYVNASLFVFEICVWFDIIIYLLYISGLIVFVGRLFVFLLAPSCIL